MKTLEKQQRDNKIRQLRKQGKSLTWIGKQVGLHPERVRQICLTPVDRELYRNDLIVSYRKFLSDDAAYKRLLNQIYVLSLPDRTKDAVTKRRLLIKHLHDTLDVSFYKIGILLKRHNSSIQNLYYDR